MKSSKGDGTEGKGGGRAGGRGRGSGRGAKKAKKDMGDSEIGAVVGDKVDEQNLLSPPKLVPRPLLRRDQ